MQLHSKFCLLALFWISLKRLDRFLFKPHHIIFMLYIMPETFIKIDSLSYLEISRQTNLAYEPAKTPRYKIHCYDVMLFFFQISVHHTYLHGWCISMWILSMATVTSGLLTIVKTGLTIVSYFGNVTVRWSKTILTNYSYIQAGSWVSLKFTNKQPIRMWHFFSHVRVEHI